MKKKLHRLTENELGTYPMKDIVKGWFFRIEEVSQGFYRVTCIDEWGRLIAKEGIDPDELISECKKGIQKMSLNKT